MELKIVDFFMSWANPVLDLIFSFTNFLGEDGFAIFVFVLIYWLSSKERAFRFGSIYLISVGINTGLKSIFARPRPHNLKGHGYSFPSGHSQGYSVVASQIYLECKNNQFPKQKKWKIEILLELIIVGLLVGMGRMYFGRHYLSDVIAGLTLGVAVAYLFDGIFNLINEKFKINIKKLLLIALPIILAIYFVITFTSLINYRSIFKLYSVTGFSFGAILGYFMDKYALKSKIEGDFINRLKKTLFGLLITGALYFVIKTKISNIYFVPLMFVIFAFFSVGIMPTLLNKTFVVKKED